MLSIHHFYCVKDCVLFLHNFIYVKISILALSHVILSYYAVEMITRFIYTCEEFFNHFKSRYESNIAELLMFTFSFPYGSVALIVLSAMVALHFFMVHGWVDRKLNTSSFLNVLVFVFMLTKYLKDVRCFTYFYLCYSAI